MKVRIINGIPKIMSLPNSYGNVINGYKERVDLHEKDGFLDLVTPDLKDNEELGKLIKTTEGFYTYEVLQIPKKTEEEIQAEEELVKKSERNQKLRDGIIVSDIWFNEDKLTQFTVMAQMCKNTGVEVFEWGKESGWGVVTVEEALAISLEASQKFSAIYKEYF